MPDEFELFKEVNKKSTDGGGKSETKTIVAEKHIIKYQEYELLVEGKLQIVLIPIRECQLFEKTLENFNTINKIQLKKILYNHRGIRKLK